MPIRKFTIAAALIVTMSTGAQVESAVQKVDAARLPRIVSMAPSVTEDLFAVGAGGQVVGVSTYTDYPPDARRLPVVAASGWINAERIISLHPDLCIGIASQYQISADLRRAGITVVLLNDDNYEDIFANILRVGELSHHRKNAEALVGNLHARTTALARSAPRRTRRPDVFVTLGITPIYTAGPSSYISRLIALAGGANAASIRDPYARFSADALIVRQPDIIIADPEVHLSDVLERPPWNSLRAVKLHHTYILPDAAILERPGPRYNEGLAWLIDVIRQASANRGAGP